MTDSPRTVLPNTGRKPAIAPKPPELDAGGLDRHVGDLPVDAKRIKGLGPLTGRVSSTSTILGGTGFTVTDTGVGTFTVTFNAPYAIAPTVILTPTVTSALFLAATTTTSFNVDTGAADHDFNFVVFPTV
jgi:hypothetical protein